jgi:hypothetical protein
LVRVTHELIGLEEKEEKGWIGATYPALKIRRHADPA